MKIRPHIRGSGWVYDHGRIGSRGDLPIRTLRESRMKKPDSHAAWFAGVLTMALGLAVATDARGAAAVLCQKPNRLVILRGRGGKAPEASVRAPRGPRPPRPA